MSRIGKQPVKLSEKATVIIDSKNVTVSGPKGELTYAVSPLINVEHNEDGIVFTMVKESREAKAQWGLWRSIVANAATGVTEGFEKSLELVGVGYRVQKKGTALELAVGYSHKIDVEAPEGITFDIDEGKIKVSGIDRQLVGQVAANIRSVRPPEPYKGKGIRYAGEVIHLKPGKAAKVEGA